MFIKLSLVGGQTESSVSVRVIGKSFEIWKKYAQNAAECNADFLRTILGVSDLVSL